MQTRTCFNSYRSREARRAFTLIELLVVIGIIALLLGILVPVLGRARSSGQIVSGMANQRNLFQGVTTDAGGNKGYLPGMSAKGQLQKTAYVGSHYVSDSAGGVAPNDPQVLTTPLPEALGDYFFAYALEHGCTTPAGIVSTQDEGASVCPSAPAPAVVRPIHYSYAIVHYASPDLRNAWRVDYVPHQEIMLADRCIDPDQAAGYSSALTPRGSGQWIGGVCYGDAHTELSKTPTFDNLKYGSVIHSVSNLFGTGKTGAFKADTDSGRLWHARETP